MLILSLLFLISPCFTGDKVYTDEDLKNFKVESGSGSGEILEVPELGFSLPEMPPGVSKEIKTKYRVIEHAAGDPKVRQISIYDTNKIKKVSEEDLEIYPPVYYQIYGVYEEGQWWRGIEKKAFQNVFRPELVIIIENTDPLKIYKMKDYPYKYGIMGRKEYQSGNREIKDYKYPPKISLEDAQRIIFSQLKYKKSWELKGFPYKEGIIICGYNSVLPSAIAVWWWKEGYIYNINTVAKANTTFDFTFDISVIDGYEFCQKNR